jgi:peptidoglycan DL-endopeptidase CwlO
LVSLAAATAALTIMLPGGPSDAQTTRAARQSLPKPTLAQLVAQATALSNEVTSLGQQYDGLALQLSHAQAEVKLAQAAANRDARQLAGSQRAVARLAAGSYMDNGLDPTLQMLTGGDPELFLSQASIVTELNNQAGMRLTRLQTAKISAQRAQLAAQQQIAQVKQLKAQMSAKLTAAQAKMNILNSSAMAKAMQVFNETGSYPDYTLPLISNAGTRALKYALAKVGDPYVWGATGPSSFDCSGLVVWAYAQEGISLPHYTGALWNSGMHVSRDALEPGDLVFFYADISHVGIYLGNGLMVAAPRTGENVKVQPINWSIYVGAVRIALSPKGAKPAPLSNPRPVQPLSGSWADEGEQGGLADALPGQHDHQAVDAHAHAAGGRHGVLQRPQEVLIELHGLRVAAGGQQ